MKLVYCKECDYYENGEYGDLCSPTLHSNYYTDKARVYLDPSRQNLKNDCRYFVRRRFWMIRLFSPPIRIKEQP